RHQVRRNAGGHRPHRPPEERGTVARLRRAARRSAPEYGGNAGNDRAHPLAVPACARAGEMKRRPAAVRREGRSARGGGGPPRGPRMSPAPEATLDELVAVRALAAGGRAVAKLADWRTVFVSRALPGDVVRVRRARVHATYVEATQVELVEAGPVRRLPVCADEARCGGCDWMAFSLEAQRRHKQDIVRQSLLRVGRVPAERLPERLPLFGGAELGYRRRV